MKVTYIITKAEPGDSLVERHLSEESLSTIADRLRDEIIETCQRRLAVPININITLDVDQVTAIDRATLRADIA